MNSELTVFVTVYNIAKYLPRFFGCMATQSFSNYILLLIDDGSTDNSLEVCKNYAKQDDRIRIIESKHIGISAARNTILQHITSPFTASADGDDVYEKDYLKHLVDAQKKYDADLVISRVCYRSESYQRTGEFVPRGEVCIGKAELKDNLPMLIDDRRLNYLYGKLYRTKLLSDLKVEEDVKQGSDTMFNCQYIKRVNRVVLIDDLDTNYIKYSSRSVTSYNGEDAFNRLCRINQFILDTFSDTEYMTDELQRVIDGRILLSAIWVLDQIALSSAKRKDKHLKATTVINNGLYRTALKRQQGIGGLDVFPFKVVYPGNEVEYVDSVIMSNQKEKNNAVFHKVLPQFMFDIYHRIKK